MKFLNKITWLIIILLVPKVLLAAEQHKYLNSNVLGTSMTLTIRAPKAQSDSAEQAVLQEIKRLQAIFSSYDASSEISQINLGKKSQDTPISDELIELVSLCEKWRKEFPQAFSCRMGDVINAWHELEETQTRPDRRAIRKIAKRAISSKFSAKEFKHGNQNKDFSWNFGAIAKGYILDKALNKAKQLAPDATAIAIDIGGDGRYWQQNEKLPLWKVGLALPNSVDDSGEVRLGEIGIHNGAIAYSGHGSRSRKIDGRSYSHILQPRDGWHAQKKITAVVRAETGTEADVVATALTVMDISEALDWIDARPKYSALLIADENRQYPSKNWYQSNYSAAKLTTELARISFKLANPVTDQYRKPYVAIWVEDSQRQVSKNLLLLGDSERWMKSNRKWWRQHGRKNNSLLDGFSRPTRKPGEYQLLWDGRDDFGKLLPAGSYVLMAEVAREHGDHEILKIPFELGDQKLTKTKKGKKELLSLSLDLKASQISTLASNTGG